MAARQAEPPAAAQPAPAGGNPLAELEQLLTTPVEVPALAQEVTTVSGQESTVGKSPAAVFVITQEMIRRSGFTTIPECLRLAPGLQVARVNSSQWAITSRGFNTNIAGLVATNNKLLVLIDGRTVFTPFFNGTYWDVQDMILADIDRIEVIRGPGATIWGANAVNGVVNIITKRAADTQGGLAQAGGGSVERNFASGRVGGTSANGKVAYRVYGKWFERDASQNPTTAQTDDWRQGRGGFRADWTPDEGDLFTLQGDIYGGNSGFTNTAVVPNRGDDERLDGTNLVGRWTRSYADDDAFILQAYYDRADRSNNLGFLSQQFDTYDVDFRNYFPIGTRQNFIWGVGYRSVSDRINSLTSPPNTVISFNPSARTYDTVSLFAQDELELTESLFLTLGSKLQWNDFTDSEIQPTARLLYSPESSWALWSAVSRAVRTPSRIESDGTIAAGTIPILQFRPNFYSEDMIAYEIGYRSQPQPYFSWDIAMFYNQYEHLGSYNATPVTLFPIFNTNNNRGEGYGFELSSTVDLTSNWRLMAYYAFLQLQIHPGAGTIDFLGSRGALTEGSSPHNQALLMSTHDLPGNFELDFVGRYVDNLPVQRVPAYTTLDIRLAWHPHPRTEIAVVGQNLLDPLHPEYGIPPSEIKRGVYGMLTRRW